MLGQVVVVLITGLVVVHGVVVERTLVVVVVQADTEVVHRVVTGLQ